MIFPPSARYDMWNGEYFYFVYIVEILSNDKDDTQLEI